jgi:glycosyltransferase involved in cell wall biosynthesis
MKIAIDISQTIYGTGVSVYTKNLVENLIKFFPQDEFILFGGSLRRRKELELIAKKLKGTIKIIPFPPTVLDFLWNSLHILPIDKFIGQVDIVHTSDWTEPPSKYPKVTTVHDLIPFIYPQTTTDIIRQAHKKRLAWVVRESEKIIAVSHSTKEDLISILKVPESKIVVIPEGVDDHFCPQPLEIIDSIKRKYRIKGDYIFSLSTLEPRKNQKGLIEAFKVVKEKYPEMQLVLGGKTGWGDIPDPIPGVLMPGFIPESDLPALYAGAAVFALPSFYEGFGLPPLQAMACGAPVVTSNVSSMPEVVGDAGILVDPTKVEEIVAGIIKAIENQPELREKGFIQAKKFTWERAAKETYNVYQQVISKYKNK